MLKTNTGLPYEIWGGQMFIPTGTEVAATNLRRARKVYRGDSWAGGSCYKLASHKEDASERLYIWSVHPDGSAILEDDDADHLNRPESEGIFEMRCYNLDLEGRALMADYLA